MLASFEPLAVKGGVDKSEVKAVSLGGSLGTR
jgi:hypothetical protein